MKGQINLSYLVIGGIGLIVTLFGSVTAINNRTDDKVGGVQKEVAQISERAAKLETIVPIIDKRLEGIEKSLKMIEQKLK